MSYKKIQIITSSITITGIFLFSIFNANALFMVFAFLINFLIVNDALEVIELRSTEPAAEIPRIRPLHVKIAFIILGGVFVFWLQPPHSIVLQHLFG